MPKAKVAPRQKHIPLRTCIGTKEQHPKSEMIRIVRTPEGDFIVDGVKGKANGRGAYLSPTVEAFEQALKRKALQHAFKQKIPEEALNRLKDAFIARLLGEHS